MELSTSPGWLRGGRSLMGGPGDAEAVLRRWPSPPSPLVLLVSSSSSRVWWSAPFKKLSLPLFCSLRETGSAWLHHHYLRAGMLVICWGCWRQEIAARLVSRRRAPPLEEGEDGLQDEGHDAGHEGEAHGPPQHRMPDCLQGFTCTRQGIQWRHPWEVQVPPARLRTHLGDAR